MSFVCHIRTPTLIWNLVYFEVLEYVVDRFEKAILINNVFNNISNEVYLRSGRV